MLTLVGNDAPGIVAKVTQTLFKHKYSLGEASMLRLGGNFSIMMMVRGADSADDLRQCLSSVIKKLGFHLHIDEIEGRLHSHHIPNVMITVSGADRGGIIAQVSGKLFEAGLDILNLDSDVAGTNEHPIYIMRIEGVVSGGINTLLNSVEELKESGVDISMHAIETLVG